jgi:hypothetical protein
MLKKYRSKFDKDWIVYPNDISFHSSFAVGVQVQEIVLKQDVKMIITAQYTVAENVTYNVTKTVNYK